MNVTVVQDPDGHLCDMTVGDLRRALRGLPPDRLVVLSSDAEGNQFHPLMQVAPLGIYQRERFAGGEVVEIEEARAGDEKCVVLWPMD